MKWFWRWVERRIENAQDCERTVRVKKRSQEVLGRDINASRSFQSDSIVFRMYQSAGGHIIEVTHDQIGDPVFPTSSLYIIRDEDDLGDSLKRILTVEALKN